MNSFRRTIINELHSLESLMYTITNFLEDQGVSSRAVYRINLALEEIITNTIKYGYNDCASHEIHVSIEVDDETVTTLIEDDGREFNPLEQKEINPDIPIEERKVGGLGIHLIRNLLDFVDYRREGHRNFLEIRTRKNIPSGID